MDLFELWQSGLCYEDVSEQNEAKMIAVQQLIDTINDINDVESRKEEVCPTLTNSQEEAMQLEGGRRL